MTSGKLVTYKVRIRYGQFGLMTVSVRATTAAKAREIVAETHPGHEVVRTWRSEYAR